MSPNMSCSDVVCRVCWTNDFYHQKDTGSAGIPWNEWRSHMELCRVVIVKVVFFFGMSCSDGVFRLGWTGESFTWVDTGKVCILSMLRRVQFKLS